MAKIRVEQIKDLVLTPAGEGTTPVTRSIQIGTSNSIVPLTNVEVSGTGDYISGASVSGNIVTLTKAALPGITVALPAGQNLPATAVPFVRDITANGHTITKSMGTIGNGLAITDNGVLNLNLAVTPAAGSTGQVISGLSYANGVLAPTYSTVAAADVTIADADGKFTATNVEGALAELAAIDPVITTVAAGTGISVTPSATTEGGNDVTYTVAADLNLSIGNETEGEGDSAVTTTYLYIKDTEGELISKVNANAFVKDGFLQKVEKDAENNTLKFTWNTDAGIEETTISISDLCDVYTADETYLHLDGYKFEHKTSGVTASEYAANAADVTVDSTTSQSFKVPTLTVNAAGHVTAASEKTVTIALPGSIDTAVQTVTGDTYVAASKSGTTVTLATKTKAVADATADAEGLATAHSVKSYVDGKIEALDTPIEGVSSAATNNVKVTVKQVDGIVNSVEVVDNSINATNLQTAIEALDADKSGSNTNNDITVQVVETDGKITAVNVSDTLKSVAHTGAAADVKLSEGVSVIAATNVEGALAEIATEIDNMDLAATDVVALSADGLSLKAGKIKEEDGKVTVEAAATLVTFNQALSDTNNVATMADVKTVADAAKLTGEKAIEVKAATGEGATGKVVSLKIKSDDKILDQTAADGLFSTLSLTYDTAAQVDGKKYIRLKGKNNADISTIDATEFIKDGMLESAELVTNPDGQEAGKYIKLTFNLTDAQGGNDPIFINVTDLVDVYSADETYITLGTDNKFSHKTPTTLTAGTYGDNTADVTADAAGETAEFKVPSVTVDAAGHVTVASEKTVKVVLPAAPTTAEKTIVTYEPKKESFTPAAGTTTVKLAAEASDYDVYLNGQLLSAGDATLGNDKKTITLSNYASMITAGDEIIVRYFVKHEDIFTVFAPAQPQA